MDNLFNEYELHISNLKPDTLSVLLRDTKWYYMPELELEYNIPITFTIKIPNRDKMKTYKNINQIINILNKIENLL
tara:strand:- start:670 stop:897 length:228 start_codon:yes stop_codon:yes gene_type:complete